VLEHLFGSYKESFEKLSKGNFNDSTIVFWRGLFCHLELILKVSNTVDQ
jgi:hypothetical protein